MCSFAVRIAVRIAFYCAAVKIAFLLHCKDSFLLCSFAVSLKMQEDPLQTG